MTNFEFCPDIETLRTIEPSSNNQLITICSEMLSNLLNTEQTNSCAEFRSDLTDAITADDNWLCIVTSSGKRWKRVIKGKSLNLELAGITSGDDISIPLTQAINYVDNYVRKYGFKSRPVISISSGNYYLSRNITMPSWVSLVAYGNVELNATAVISGHIISITNTVAGVDTVHYKGDNISSIGGTIFITGPGQDSTSPNGVFIGNTSPGKAPCRNVKISNVAVKNTNFAVCFSSIDTYMTMLSDCHLEYNYINVSSPDSLSTNSGETMKFYNVVLSHSIECHVYNNTPAMDMCFTLCNFDFTNGDVIKLGKTATYLSIRIVSTHIEAWDGYLLGGPDTALSNTIVMIEHPLLLPRARKAVSGSLVNSPSRPLTNTPTQLLLNGLDLRHEYPPYTEDIFMTDYPGVTVSNYLKDPFRQVPSRSYILNRGWDFSNEVVGASLSANEFVSIFAGYRNSMEGVITTRNDGKGNQLTVNSTSLNGSLVLNCEKIPVQPGCSYHIFSAIQALSATGRMRLVARISWLDSDGNIIGLDKSVYNADMRAVYDNESLPNYSEGTSRYIAATATPRVAPPGAVAAYPQMEFSQFLGEFNISRLVCAKVT